MLVIRSSAAANHQSSCPKGRKLAGRSSTTRFTALFIVAFAAFASLRRPRSPPTNGNNSVELNGSGDPDASGKAIVNDSEGRGDFNGTITVQNLNPGETYSSSCGAGPPASGSSSAATRPTALLAFLGNLGRPPTRDMRRSGAHLIRVAAVAAALERARRDLDAGRVSYDGHGEVVELEVLCLAREGAP